MRASERAGAAVAGWGQDRPDANHWNGGRLRSSQKAPMPPMATQVAFTLLYPAETAVTLGVAGIGFVLAIEE
jgi:hypothetical protein